MEAGGGGVHGGTSQHGVHAAPPGAPAQRWPQPALFTLRPCDAGDVNRVQWPCYCSYARSPAPPKENGMGKHGPCPRNHWILQLSQTDTRGAGGAFSPNFTQSRHSCLYTNVHNEAQRRATAQRDQCAPVGTRAPDPQHNTRESNLIQKLRNT